MVELVSPFPAYAIPRVWGWIEQFRDRVADDFSPRTLEAFVEHWEAADAAGRKTWAVVRDSEIGGVITARRMSPIVADAHCVFAKRFWGSDTTLPSLRLAFDELYRDGVSKIVSAVFADNRSIIALIHKVGGCSEGRMVAQTLRRGKPTDMVLIAIHKERFYVVPGKRPDERSAGLRAAEHKPAPDAYPKPAVDQQQR